MQNTIQTICDQLRGIYPEKEAKNLASLVMESVCGLSKHDLLFRKDKELSASERIRIENIVAELKKNKPVQYVLGETEFYGLRFLVNENVLIPRPETEELVDLIIRSTSLSGTDPKTLYALDIGAGSGCIAISLAKHIPHINTWGIDISPGALGLAKQNAVKNQVDVKFIEQDVFNEFTPETFPDSWDIIVSNPPYVTMQEKNIMHPNVLDYEPGLALFVPDNQPLLFYERIADIGLEKLSTNGRLYLETSALYGKDTAQMLISKGYGNVSLFQDISGNDRIIQAYL